MTNMNIVTGNLNLEVKDGEFFVTIGNKSVTGKSMTITIDSKVKDFAPGEFRQIISGKSDDNIVIRQRKLTPDEKETVVPVQVPGGTLQEETQQPHFEFSWLAVKKRLSQEVRLLKSRCWWQILTSTFLIIYIFAIVSRNLAFYFHEPLTKYVVNGSRSVLTGHRLRDIGFAVTPDWSRSHAISDVNEAMVLIILIIPITTAILPIFYTCTHERPYFMNILTRFLWVLMTGHAMRALSYLSTSIPGPASHCIDVTQDGHGMSLVKMNRPKDIYDIFFSWNHIANCGDAVFSGHMLLVTTGVCCGVFYLNKMTNVFVTRCVSFLCFILVIVQAFLVLATRNHYTVDIILGIMVGFLNWILHLYVILPADPSPTSRTLSVSKYHLPFHVKSVDLKIY